ncbi:MAG: beta-xylosidase [Bryobacteraceae bacterium]
MIWSAFALLLAPQAVTVSVDAHAVQGSWRHVWQYFGHDEPNYTYMRHGRKLLTELAALSPEPVYIRVHNLLTSGDGTPALKWGSTNVYTEDAAGRPVYDWKIMDRIFDTWIERRMRPFVEIGFMPEALSVKPQPYLRRWPKPDDGKGWAYPPRDYARWGELIYQWVRHSVERYGRREVAAWFWELWNEPDISYWQGTPEEYFKLYEVTVRAVKRALPEARVGGPGTTGPGNPKAAAFLRNFLAACDRTGIPLDFISYHAKGRPQVVEGRVRMGTAKELTDVSRGMEIIASFPRFRKLPIYLTEADPEGCAACSARVYPHNAYRNTTLYPANYAVVLRGILELAARHQVNLQGVLTWAFEFEDQPWFDGFRTLATNGVDKPVLNVFRMLGLLHGDRIKAESDAAVPLDELLSNGLRDRPDINAIATRAPREISILLWNTHDDDLPAEAAAIKLSLAGIEAPRVQLRHYRIDETHSNAYTLWKKLGAPAPELESAGQLQMLHSPEFRTADNGRLALEFALPRQALSLVQVSW